MDVSVITATLPGDVKFLESAYDSIANTALAFEWLIQVDGPQPVSLPATLARDDRVSVAANHQQMGPGISRNRALARSRGRFLQNLDADDQLEPGTLESLAMPLMADEQLAFSFGHARDLVDDGQLVEFAVEVEPGRIEPGVIPPLWRSDPHDYSVPIHPAGIMWRRQPLVAMGGWPGLWGFDDTGLLMTIASLWPGYFVDVPTLRYRKRSGQFTEAVSHARHDLADQTMLVHERIRLLADVVSVISPRR